MQRRNISPFKFDDSRVIKPLSEHIQSKLDKLSNPDKLFEEQDGRLFYEDNKAIAGILVVANSHKVSQALIELFNIWPDTGYLSTANIIRARHFLNTLFLDQLTTNISETLNTKVSETFTNKLKKAIVFAITIENLSFFNAMPSSEAKLLMLNKIFDQDITPTEIISNLKDHFFRDFNQRLSFTLNNLNSKTLSDDLATIFEGALNNNKLTCLENHHATLFQHILEVLVPLNLSLSPEYDYISFPSTHHDPKSFRAATKKDLNTINHKMATAIITVLNQPANQNKTLLNQLHHHDRLQLLKLLGYLQKKQGKSNHSQLDKLIKNLRSSMIKSEEPSPRHADTVPELRLRFSDHPSIIFARPRSLSHPDILSPRESPTKSSSSD